MQQMFHVLPVHRSKYWVGANDKTKKIVVRKSLVLHMLPVLPVHPSKYWVGINDKTKKIVVRKSLVLLHNHHKVSESNQAINGRIAGAT